jgi:hypothetical protein
VDNFNERDRKLSTSVLIKMSSSLNKFLPPFKLLWYGILEGGEK